MTARKSAAVIDVQSPTDVQAPSEIQTPAEQQERQASNSNHLEIWNGLSHTAPHATKDFSRQGGFKGTAIKPIWQEKMMTETFGPVGFGWGMTKPDYEHVVVGEEVLVYCTIGVWYKWQGAKSDLFWGEGGDAMVKKRRDGGVQIDDEARKKSLTDALSNAFKRLGMAADIHMGLWGDSKYQTENADYWFWKAVTDLEAELPRKLQQVSTTTGLLALKKANKDLILAIKDADDEVYDRIVGLFAKREAELAAPAAKTLERVEQPKPAPVKQIERAAEAPSEPEVREEAVEEAPEVPEASAGPSAEPSVTEASAPAQAVINEVRTGQPQPSDDFDLPAELVIDPRNFPHPEVPKAQNWPEWRKACIAAIRKVQDEETLDKWVARHQKTIDYVSRFTTIGNYPNGAPMTGTNVVDDINLWLRRQRAVAAGTSLSMRFATGNAPGSVLSFYADALDWAQTLEQMANSAAGYGNVAYNVDQAKALAEQHKGTEIAALIHAALSIAEDQRKAKSAA